MSPILLLLLAMASIISMPQTSTASQVSQAAGLFATDLFKQITSAKEGNLVFSPLSVHAVLSMAYQGAAGSTQDAIKEALKVDSPQTAADGYRELLNHLNSLEKVELNLANKIFVDAKKKLKDTFADVNSNSFHSEVQSVNFEDNVQTAETINSWVRTQTKDKIKEIFSADAFDASTALVLANTVYLKGEWLANFDREATGSQTFYVNDDKQVTVDMMRTDDFLEYKEDTNLDAQILKMPFTNEDVSMFVILPNKTDGIKELEEKISELKWEDILQSGFGTEKLVVELPKFKIELKTDLKEVLSKMGLEELFDPSKCNLSEMIEPRSGGNLYVDKAVQKAFIDVNEDGVEAAAATGIKVSALSLALKSFIADHPFLFVIAEKTGENLNILFLGRVQDPSA